MFDDQKDKIPPRPNLPGRQNRFALVFTLLSRSLQICSMSFSVSWLKIIVDVSLDKNSGLNFLRISALMLFSMSKMRLSVLEKPIGFSNLCAPILEVKHMIVCRKSALMQIIFYAMKLC